MRHMLEWPLSTYLFAMTTDQNDQPVLQASYTPHIPLSYRLPILIGVALLLIGGSGLIAFLSSRTLPGDAFYTTKTEFMEPMIGATKFSSSQKAHYNVSLLERRLHELQLLRTDTATTTPEALSAVASLVQDEVKNTEESLSVMRRDTPERTLDILLDMLTVTDAHSTLSRTVPEFEPLEETLEDARGRAFDLLKETTHAFASSSPTSAASRLGDEIRTLETELPDVADGSQAKVRALQHLDNARDTIAAGDIGDALFFIFRARQAIAVDGYLFDSERGLTDDEPAPPQVPTEGQ